MSDLGRFSECLVDSDSDARMGAPRLRRKALVLSVILEALLLVTMLVWPLITPGVLTPRYIETPVPPYADGGPAHHGRAAVHPPHDSPIPTICGAVCAPVVRPQQPTGPSDAPDVDANIETGGYGPSVPGSGPGILGSVGDHPALPEPPRAPPQPVKPRPMGESVMAAMLIRRIEPAYPAIARNAGISGTVHLHAIIGKDGSVRALEVVDGNILLAQAARAAVQGWRYRPTLLNGEPVEVETYITVNFVLN